MQLVYQQNDLDTAADQDGWFVLEGLRDAAGDGPILGVDGIDGETTLSEANKGFTGFDLIQEIGSPSSRGSVIVGVPGSAFSAWETMTEFGAAIDEQMLPYIGFGPPGSVIPTINSSSVVASLLFYAGVDITNFFGLA